MGNVIDHRYALIHKLGEGLFGEVYLVYENGQYWALKLLKGELKNLDQGEGLSIFKKEFLLLKELRHPGIAHISDFGLDRDLGRYYFTSEYIGGSDLWEVSKDLDYAKIEELFVQILRALQYLHQYGIVHGDLKPENILVKTDEEPWQGKLIDFGVAVFKEPGKIMGSPTYIAPEIFAGTAHTPTSDLYAIGVVLYSILARYNPFKADTLQETIEKQKTFVPPPIYTINPNVPLYLQHILDRLLDKSPSARYGQAATVIQDLNFLGGKDYALETEHSRYAYIPCENKLRGRDKELAAFKDLFQQIFKKLSADASRLFVVAGDVGMGKTRLISEFKTYAQINDVHVEVIDDVRPLDIYSDKPTVFWLRRLEDYPEGILLDAVRQSIGQPVLIIGEAKTWTHDLPSSCVVTLLPLPRAETVGLLAEVFRGAPLSAEFINKIVTCTHGSPLFLQGIIRKLVDEAWKHDSSGKWDEETIAHLAAYLEHAEVPSTLADFLKDRLKDLHDPDPYIVLALLERPASSGDLMSLFGNEDLSHRLLDLSAGAWITRDTETNLWSIGNPLVARHMLDRLPPSVRAAWEEKIGMMLAKKDEKDPKALYYLSRSLNVDVARQAAEGAYHHYWEREDHPLAYHYITRLLELSGELPLTELIRFKMSKSECAVSLRRFDEGIALLEQCLDELTALPIDESSLNQRLECLKKLGSIYLKTSRLHEATEAYQSGLTLASILKSGMAHRLYFENAKAHVKIQEGQLDAALKAFHNTWQVWQMLGEADQAQVPNCDLGRVLYLTGRYQEALEQLKAELAFFRRVNNFFFEARACYHLADTHMALKAWDEAIAHYEAGIAIGKAHRAYDLLIRLYNGLGNVYQMRQEMEKSIAAYEKALRYTRHLSETPAMAGILTNLGILYHRTGKKYDAFSHLTCAIHLIGQLPSRRAYELQCLARSHLELGGYYINANDSRKAEGHLRDALTLCTTHKGIESLLPWVLERLVRVTLELSPESEDLSEWFKLWEKHDASVKTDADNTYHGLYKRWLDRHLTTSPFRKRDGKHDVDDITRALAHVTTTTTYAELDLLEHEEEDFTEPPLSETSVRALTVLRPEGGQEEGLHLLSWQEFEAAYIAQTLFANRFHMTKTARSLKLTRATLYRKINHYHLEKVSPLSFSINIPLSVPLGLSLKRALFCYLSSLARESVLDGKKMTQILGVSRTRVERLLCKGREEGWEEPLADAS